MFSQTLASISVFKKTAFGVYNLFTAPLSIPVIVSNYGYTLLGLKLPDCTKKIVDSYFPFNLDDVVVHPYGLPFIVRAASYLGFTIDIGALTFGDNIFFPNNYDPYTLKPAGLRGGIGSIIHELVHVAQYHQYTSPGFLTFYFGETLARIFTNIYVKGSPDINGAYAASSFEQEAYSEESRIVSEIISKGTQNFDYPCQYIP